jgi:SAM-dependent methyltransferase
MKKILDACCGGRMFWFDKKNPRALFIDNRVMKKQVIWKKGKEKRTFEVVPDMIMDFRKMNLSDNTFSLVVFDPPHLMKRNGKTGWLNKKYSSLDRNSWQNDIRQGFSECFRVLKPNGVLVFKWCETEIPLTKILELTPERPLFGHRSGKAQRTHWITFMKLENGEVKK